MTCSRCHGLILIEYLDAEPVQRCLNCGAHTYPPLPTTAMRTKCYYCAEGPAPGMGACQACLDKMKQYRQAHPKARKKYGPMLSVVQEVQRP